VPPKLKSHEWQRGLVFCAPLSVLLVPGLRTVALHVARVPADEAPAVVDELTVAQHPRVEEKILGSSFQTIFFTREAIFGGSFHGIYRENDFLKKEIPRKNSLTPFRVNIHGKRQEKIIHNSYSPKRRRYNYVLQVILYQEGFHRREFVVVAADEVVSGRQDCLANVVAHCKQSGLN
jgi:hypothetical protein